MNTILSYLRATIELKVIDSKTNEVIVSEVKQMDMHNLMIALKRIKLLGKKLSVWRNRNTFKIFIFLNASDNNSRMQLPKWEQKMIDRWFHDW